MLFLLKMLNGYAIIAFRFDYHHDLNLMEWFLAQWKRSIKFHRNLSITFCIFMITDKQTDEGENIYNNNSLI